MQSFFALKAYKNKFRIFNFYYKHDSLKIS